MQPNVKLFFGVLVPRRKMPIAISTKERKGVDALDGEGRTTQSCSEEPLLSKEVTMRFKILALSIKESSHICQWRPFL